MAYREQLADRLRIALDPALPLEERRMFGGLIFLFAGRMLCVTSGEDVMFRVGEALMEDLYRMKENASGAGESKWAQNKYSIYADLGLAALFFIVSKVTGDLVLAAIVGGVTGLGLIVLQRFVKVDLLGGFAVFGTIMLAISTAFSLVLQDSYWVQMKGTALGLFTASLFMADGLLRPVSYTHLTLPTKA